MKGLALLLMFSFTLRFSGALMRTHGMPGVVKAAGWIFCTASIWIGAGSVGAWFPLWTAVAAGGAGWLAALKWNGWPARLGADQVVVVCAAVLSVPSLSIITQTGLFLAVAAIGATFDYWASHKSKTQASRIVVAMGVGAILAVAGLLLAGWAGLGPGRQLYSTARTVGRHLPHAGITTPRLVAERIELPNGGVAWLERPANQDPSLGALFFHGAHPDGARQKAARILRRSLLKAGFLVLSVDHPGFGESSLPADRLDLAAWDPMPNGVAALAEMEKRIAPDKIVLVGHSMGCTEALRLLGIRPEIRGAILFGASLPDPAGRDAYWHMRFHRDRRIDEKIPAELVLRIREQFYDNAKMATELPDTHPPIHFVRFGTEHNNIKATRDALYDSLPGRKRVWDLQPSDHYFSTTDFIGLQSGDTRASRACARLLRAIQEELSRSET